MSWEKKKEAAKEKNEKVEKRVKVRKIRMVGERLVGLNVMETEIIIIVKYQHEKSSKNKIW
jgi:hypothetical protein